MTNLSDGVQQTIADKVLKEESHWQYRQVVGKEKKAKTSERRKWRKFTAATVVTSETVLQLREQRERVDREKAPRKAKKPSTPPDTTLPLQAHTKVGSKSTKMASIPPPIIPTGIPDEVEALGEDLEDLELGGSTRSDSGSEYGGPQPGRARLRGKNIQKVSDILQLDKNVGLEVMEVMSKGLEGMESVDNGVRRSRQGLRSQK